MLHQDLGMAFTLQYARKKELLSLEEIVSQLYLFGLQRTGSLETKFIGNFIKIWDGNYLSLNFKKRVS